MPFNAGSVLHCVLLPMRSLCRQCCTYQLGMLCDRSTALLQEGLLAEATAFRDANIVDVASYEELKQAIEDGRWARGPWAGQHCFASRFGDPISCDKCWTEMIGTLCRLHTPQKAAW